MRDLAIRALNDATVTDSDRQTLNTEFESRRDEITRKANATTFNLKYLLSGAYSAGQEAQVTPDNNAGTLLTIVIPAMTACYIANANSGLVSADATLSNLTLASFALGQVDVALNYVNSVQTSLGVQERRLNYIINDLNAMEINMTAAKSNITDADMASEITHFAKLQIISQAATSVIAQANNIQQRVVGMLDVL